MTGFYESVGSKYLSDRITYNVKPGKKVTRDDCKVFRDMILAKLPIFLHGLDERLKEPTMDLRKDESSFIVTGCEDLKVEKILDYSESTSDPKVHNASAEITQDGSLFTLWLTGEVEMYEYVKLASSYLYIYNIFL